ncbi:hypothetical protein PhCBS80983_g02354 [Powellomyces hirtus]|uniref:Uncharacterized protein n=1 Tax=Powellomyces hirtus TaxID=109895 RepID=A0A507E8C0_9FUNG|nr:hypothetical protein PhCBS80983_g02354 [Powellomyces hirtus]
MGHSSCLPRFSEALKSAQSQFPNALTVFSGDAFSPSVEAAVLKGWHMVPILNELGVDVACYGNHDFDFGEKTAVELAAGCRFPWLMSNVVDAKGRRIADALEYLVVELEGFKVGFFALAGTDWPANCQHLPADSRIVDPVATAQKMIAYLRTEANVDFVIALTHMRLPEDLLVVGECPGMDLVLGGHDHEYSVTERPGWCSIVKSGSDFHDLSIVHMVVDVQDRSLVRVDVERQTNFTDPTYPSNKAMTAIISKVQAQMSTILDRALLYSEVDLDGRSAVGRTSETNLGNLLADLLRHYYQCDIAFVNSGSIRCNRVIPSGPVSVRDMFGALPFGNVFVTKRVIGKDLLTALENSVGDSRTDGRFLQLSGLGITVNLAYPAGQRVISAHHHPATASHPSALDPSRVYSVAMINFIADGFDGYDSLKAAEHSVNTESGVSENAMLMQVFADPGSDACEQDEGARRAREALVKRTRDGLPAVAPVVEGRIIFV